VEESDVEECSREEKKEGKRKLVESKVPLADEAEPRADERKRYQAGQMSKEEEQEIALRAIEELEAGQRKRTAGGKKKKKKKAPVSDGLVNEEVMAGEHDGVDGVDG
jgi:hypothetical protein